jgi:hypothetical protein
VLHRAQWVCGIYKGAAMMPISDQERRIRELFDAHYTITELSEKTGLSLDAIIKVLNAPRPPKQRAVNSWQEELQRGMRALGRVA